MKKRTKIILASALTISVVGGVAAHNRMRNGGPGEYMKYHLTGKLQLSDAQASRLDAVNDSARVAWQQFRDSRRGAMEQIMALLESGQFDQDGAMQLVREKSRQFENHAEQLIAAVAGFTDSLDDKQKQELQEMIRYRMENRGHHRKHGAGHGSQWMHGDTENQMGE